MSPGRDSGGLFLSAGPCLSVLLTSSNSQNLLAGFLHLVRLSKSCGTKSRVVGEKRTVAVILTGLSSGFFFFFERAALGRRWCGVACASVFTQNPMWKVRPKLLASRFLLPHEWAYLLGGRSGHTCSCTSSPAGDFLTVPGSHWPQWWGSFFSLSFSPAL